MSPIGLDNGIQIKRKRGLPDEVFKKFDTDISRKWEYDLEVAYWRKCWNIRSLIYSVLGAEQENDSEIPMGRQDVLNVIKALKGVNRKNWYTMGGDSVWSWSEYRASHRRNIANLQWLARVMKKRPDIDVYFYDSY